MGLFPGTYVQEETPGSTGRPSVPAPHAVSAPPASTTTSSPVSSSSGSVDAQTKAQQQLDIAKEELQQLEQRLQGLRAQAEEKEATRDKLRVQLTQVCKRDDTRFCFVSFS